MAISPDKLERYSDFVDSEHIGASYDSRKGLERLLGVLSPDPKGIVLAAMGEDWYGSSSQLRLGVSSFLKELDLPTNIWPLEYRANWSYLELKNKKIGDIVDGSLVELGAVVKKIEQSPFQRLYRRSLAGAELAVPLAQQAVRFVIEARKYRERQQLQGKETPKFVSMWRIISGVNSPTEQRRQLRMYDVIDFLVHHSGMHRETDLEDSLHIPQARLARILPALGNSGIINYTAVEIEKEGQKGKDYSVYRLAHPQAFDNLNTSEIYKLIKSKTKNFNLKTALTLIVDYIKKHPEDEYEANFLKRQLELRSGQVEWVLSLLTGLNILKRPDPGFGGSIHTLVSAHDVTHMFYDLVCTPANEIATTLSPLPLRPWQKQDLATFLQNYEEERSHIGVQGGEEVRGLLLGILSEAEGEIKLSHITDLYNEKADRELTEAGFLRQLKNLMKLGVVERSRSGYYKLVKK